MKIQYKKRKEFAYKCGEHFHQRELGPDIRYEVVSVDYCCEEMKGFFKGKDEGKDEISHLEFYDGVFGYHHTPYDGDYPNKDDVAETFEFKLCPFCGEKIGTECVEYKEIFPMWETKKVKETYITEREVEKPVIVSLREEVKTE